MVSRSFPLGRHFQTDDVVVVALKPSSRQCGSQSRELHILGHVWVGTALVTKNEQPFGIRVPRKWMDLCSRDSRLRSFQREEGVRPCYVSAMNRRLSA